VATVLALDKDPVELELLTFLLEKEGHSVRAATTPAAAFAYLEHEHVHLVIMDPVLPKHDGDRVCQQIRQLNPYTPLIIVSERGGQDHIVNSLITAADDYVTKPFSPREFLARVHALLRRAQLGGNRWQDEDITIGEISLNLKEIQVLVNGHRIGLTRRELSLLHTLMVNSPRVLNREQLMEPWGDHFVGLSKVVDVYIQRLRRKIQPHLSDGSYIHSLRGFGYKFEMPTEGRSRVRAGKVRSVEQRKVAG
jgi:two-component system, OmpR family, alkaline phosphatase synthesis response regulator PhoP